MKAVLATALVAQVPVEGLRKVLRTGADLRRLIEKDQARINSISPRVYAACDLKSKTAVSALEDYLHFDSEQQLHTYFSDKAHPSNEVATNEFRGFQVADDVRITSSNGWCDRGVYKSWNKCNINGECFQGCTDGLCYEQHRANQGRGDISVPGGCKNWYQACAEWCNEEPDCVAFSFLDTNVLGHAEYTCNLFETLTCKYSDQNFGDPRSSFHVKGRHLQEWFDKHQVNSKKDLDEKLDEDNDFKFGHWSSWGYHSCKRPDGRTCGSGTETRKRELADRTIERETRPCDFRNDDGDLLVCEEVVVEQEVIGHGWTDWGEWTPCSKSCNANGKRQRSRMCATCNNPAGNGLCSADQVNDTPVSDLVSPGGDFSQHCPLAGQKQTSNCNLGKCLPFTNGNFNGNSFKNKRGWALNPARAVRNNDNNWLGRCTTAPYKKVMLPMNNNANAFGECMRVCQVDEKAACLAVSFFPRTGSLHGVNLFYGFNEGEEMTNCYLYDNRCHETGDFTSDFAAQPTGQEDHKAWYAFKDLCSGTKICDSWGTYMQSHCISTGDHAFPNQPDCKCPGTTDRNSGMRLFGRAYGFEFYNENTGLLEMRRRYPESRVPQRAPFYSERKYENNWKRASGGLDYEESYEKNAVGCHDPCAHNQCMSGSTCRRNLDSKFGYDCVCQWPTAADPAIYGSGPNKKPIGLAGLESENGCKAIDFRNADGFTDNMILYGGGWNAQRDPVDKKLVKPYYGYYGMEATENPWKFKVREAAQKIPAPDRNAHKGKFYNCMMNIQKNEVMVLGGRPGQFFDKWDDKTFVYSWRNSADNIAQGGKWIGTTGQRMNETKESCSEHGCVRDHDWPDLPSTPLFECKGQCRGGAEGAGPTDPYWVNEYCYVNGSFFDSGAWVNKEFNLCRHSLIQVTGSNGVTLQNRNGLWSTQELTQEEYKTNWFGYIDAVKKTIGRYRGKLTADDLGNQGEKHLEQLIGGILHTGYDRWKMRMDPELYSPIVGPVDHSDMPQIFNYLRRNNYLPNFMKLPNREYHAPGQPICGVMGERAYIGSGKFARLMSLPVDKQAAAEQKVWHIEEDSQFPEPYKRSNNERCLSPQSWSDGKPTKFDPMPAYRQNFGTVTTTEGMWMIGGLVAPSGDLKGRLLNRKYNVEGCTKQSHKDDVWVFNPRGWSREVILGEALENYQGQNEAQILPQRRGYDFRNNRQKWLNQTFGDFRLSDDENQGITIEQAVEAGWECTGVQGKWCRKPFIPRHTKGAESVIMCFEPSPEGDFEPVSNFRQGDSRTIKRRPRPCTVDETNDASNNCICYIINVSGQSGLKQSPGGSGFRPEIDYLEIRRADGTWGSDKEIYQSEVREFCQDATEPYPGIDPAFVTGDEAATKDYLSCTTECGRRGQPECNRVWRKRNLRRRWHEAGRIKHPRMGFLAGTLKGEIAVWGGECFGPQQIRQWNLDGTLRMTRTLDQPRSCKIQMKRNPDGSVTTINDDYMEVFSFIRMNQAGFLFGERRYVELDGYHPGQAGHGEAAVSQAHSLMNTKVEFFQ